EVFAANLLGPFPEFGKEPINGRDPRWSGGAGAEKKRHSGWLCNPDRPDFLVDRLRGSNLLFDLLEGAGWQEASREIPVPVPLHQQARIDGLVFRLLCEKGINSFDRYFRRKFL